MPVTSNSALEMLKLTVLVTAVAGLLYFGYFQLAPWIWSQNLVVDSADIPPWYIAEMVGRDGIEVYALYALMFLNLFAAFAVTSQWNKVADSAKYLLVLPVIVAAAFLASIGFHPPINTFATRAVPDILAQSFRVMAVLLPLITLLYYLQQRSTFWVVTIAALLLIPVCFISTAPIEWYDYAYILAPALALFHGSKISEIYFQYDLLLSLIGLAWMKLRMDLNSFQIVGQIAYYLLLLGAFVFSKRWFLDKRLPVFLLIALVLVRIYAGPGDVIHSFQVTPLRLDLWLILLMLVFLKGPYHWSAGLFCGVMLLLHNNFGIIYSAAYVQLLLTLCVIDIARLPGKLIETVSMAITTFLSKNYRNLVFITVCALAHYLLFRNPNIPNDFNYVRVGFDFIKITATSFYWYVVILSGLAFVLLIKLRSRVSTNYLAAGFCLIYLVIGNSIYFFGRSHENNIINISATLVLLLFLLIDTANYFLADSSDKPIKPFFQRNLVIILSLTFIMSVAIWYGDSITSKATLQAQNAANRQLIYPSSVPQQDILNNIAEVKTITGDNRKIYFIGDNDFLQDYYGGYAPVGYYTPAYAWISQREFNKFLQELIDQGYYLVIDNGLTKDVLSSIRVSNYKYIRGCLVVWK
jgi:hypothetical protein